MENNTNDLTSQLNRHEKEQRRQRNIKYRQSIREQCKNLSLRNTPVTDIKFTTDQLMISDDSDEDRTENISDEQQSRALLNDIYNSNYSTVNEDNHNFTDDLESNIQLDNDFYLIESSRSEDSGGENDSDEDEELMQIINFIRSANLDKSNTNRLLDLLNNIKSNVGLPKSDRELWKRAGIQFTFQTNIYCSNCNRQLSKFADKCACLNGNQNMNTELILFSIPDEIRRVVKMNFHLIEFYENYRHEFILFNINVQLIVGDLPGRSKYSLLSGHTGYFSCTRCLLEGTHCNIHRHIMFSWREYQATRPEPRTEENIEYCVSLIAASKKKIRPFGVLGKSPLSTILSIPTQCVFDYFHVCLKVHLPVLISQWIELLPKVAIEKANAYLSAILYPHTFNRRPKNFSMFNQWKAKYDEQFTYAFSRFFNDGTAEDISFYDRLRLVSLFCMEKVSFFQINSYFIDWNMYHQRTSLGTTTTNNSLTQSRTNSPLTARRTLPSSAHFFSQQRRQQQQHHIQSDQDVLCSDPVQPYSSDFDVVESNSYHRNVSSRITTCDSDYISSSPSTKRKHAESSFDYGKQIDDISNFLKTVMKQQELIVDDLQLLRKSNKKLQEMTASLIRTNQLEQVSAKKPIELPIYNYKEKNLFDSISSDLSITGIHCKLIRKLYSEEEIINGEAKNEEDKRFDIVKGAMIAAFFENKPEKFDSYWKHVGSKHVGGQKRAARSRSKKARRNQDESDQIAAPVMANINSELNSQNELNDEHYDDDD
ncbi:unnamed protein product [Rotaria sordida]|uniref:Uncharacterized protein n=1 Tax=Rotaria sordida TaxID=392033 RepID=A0A815K5P6_9BILA|nr:unnamed protein product [Rotaria sordida]